MMRREIHIPAPAFITRLVGYSKPWPLIAFWAVLILGVLLRLYQFPGIPNGLNQDEMSAGYETWSLLHTGMDRWGEPWPAYFLSWGSGQNVLYSYLSLPFIAVFGLTALGVRLVAVIFGILLLPLVYVLVKRLYDYRVALLAMLLVTILPWQVMASRWALESNLLPFFLTLGVYTLGRAVAQDTSRRWRIIALLPFAIALYAYGLGLTTILGLTTLVLVVYHRTVSLHWRSWLTGGMLAALAATPFLLFFLKNYILKTGFGFEQLLPFTIPTLTETRLSELTAGQGGSPLYANLAFVVGGFQDHTPWNSLVGHPPIPVLSVLAAFFEILARLIRAARGLAKRQLPRPDIISLWLLACVPLFYLIQLNVNQANAIIVPVIILAALGVMRLIRLLPKFRAAAAGVIVFVMLVGGFGAYIEYQGPGYATWSASNFNPGVQPAFVDAARLAGSRLLYVSPSFSGNYVQTLWYLHVPPRKFQTSHATPLKPDFGNFVFNPREVINLRDYYTLLRGFDQPPCPNMQTVQKVANVYVIGYCP